ncbi:MAG: two-component system, chemotaxis family, sensor kinase CheA, partial [Actinomycetota bacterium]|nr:two-component system, chemotaxis family, sensor kinase CheA [Actinomycetota bacterium]
MEAIDEIVAEFLVESHENLDQLDRDLLELERHPDSRELLASVFRTIHTIKGTSGFLAFHKLEKLTHIGENLLSRLRDGRISLTDARANALLKMVDSVRSLLRAIEHSGGEGDSDPTELIELLSTLLEDGTVAAIPAQTTAQTAAARQKNQGPAPVAAGAQAPAAQAPVAVAAGSAAGSAAAQGTSSGPSQPTAPSGGGASGTQAGASGTQASASGTQAGASGTPAGASTPGGASGTSGASPGRAK